MRKQHTAVTFKNSMVVFGGYSDAGWVFNDMLAYHFEDNEWAKVSFAQNVPAFYQGAACSVSIKTQINERKVSLNNNFRAIKFRMGSTTSAARRTK